MGILQCEVKQQEAYWACIFFPHVGKCFTNRSSHVAVLNTEVVNIEQRTQYLVFQNLGLCS